MEICTSQRKIGLVLTTAPFLLKTGIPLLLPIAAIISAKILSWSTTSSSSSSPTSIHPSEEELKEEKAEKDSIISQASLDKAVEEHFRREIEMEINLVLHQGQKEREFRVLEINHKLCQEKTRLEFLVKEVKLMQEEAKMMGEMVIGYVKMMKEMQGLKWARGLVQSRVKKLGRRLRGKSRVAREQRKVLKARDEEMERGRVELDGKDRLIQELRNEIGVLRFSVDQLEEDKTELSNKIEELVLAKPDEIEEGFVSKEDNDYVVKELLRVEEELTNLRWENTCLRNDLISLKRDKKNDDWNFNHAEENHKGKQSGEDSGNREVIHLDWQIQRYGNTNESSSGSEINTPERHESRRKRLMKKLKGWVDGSKSSDHDKEKHGKLHSSLGSDRVHKPHYLPRRNSFSSV